MESLVGTQFLIKPTLTYFCEELQRKGKKDLEKTMGRTKKVRVRLENVLLSVSPFGS